jgi:hypothetical protein
MTFAFWFNVLILMIIAGLTGYGVLHYRRKTLTTDRRFRLLSITTLTMLVVVVANSMDISVNPAEYLNRISVRELAIYDLPVGEFIVVGTLGPSERREYIEEYRYRRTPNGYTNDILLRDPETNDIIRWDSSSGRSDQFIWTPIPHPNTPVYNAIFYSLSPSLVLAFAGFILTFIHAFFTVRTPLPWMHNRESASQESA